MHCALNATDSRALCVWYRSVASLASSASPRATPSSSEWAALAGSPSRGSRRTSPTSSASRVTPCGGSHPGLYIHSLSSSPLCLLSALRLSSLSPLSPLSPLSFSPLSPLSLSLPSLPLVSPPPQWPFGSSRPCEKSRSPKTTGSWSGGKTSRPFSRWPGSRCARSSSSLLTRR